MPQSTQYGLKNKLEIKAFKELGDNHIQVLLQRHLKNASCHLERSERSNAKAITYPLDPSAAALPQDDVYLNIIFFSPQIIRFHYSFNKDFDLNYPNNDLEFQNFDLSQKHYSKIDSDDKVICIEYSEGRIIIHKNPLQIEIFNKKEDLIDSDEPSLGFWSQNLLEPRTQSLEPKHEVLCYKQYSNLENPPQIFGLGDKTGILNRWSRRFRNAPIDALGYDSEFTDPLYKDIPFFIVRENQNFHGIFFDNFYEKFFDFGRERKPSPYYYFGAKGGELNYYFISGKNPKEILSNYLELTGKPPEHPEFTYGYLASGMSYTENNEAQGSGLKAQGEILLERFKKIKENKIPASAFHLSSGYVQDKNGLRQQFIWNPEKFPNPKDFAEAARKEGVELCVNLKPVLLTSHPWYQEALGKNLFINTPGAQSLEPRAIIVDYWGGEGSIMDFRKAQTQKWWKEKIKKSFFDNGIFGIWNDNNEYEIFEPHDAHGYEHIMPNLMTKLSAEAYTEWLNHNCKKNKVRCGNPYNLKMDCFSNARNDRPWILSRSGYAGIQKYAQTWTGDNYSSWKTLQYDIPLMTSMSISGLIHVGNDIGGFWGGKFNENPDPELLLRWIQFGVFTPRFCIHSYKETPTEPDMYKDSHPEFFQIIQNFMALRTKLIPEIVEAAHKASKSGIPIMRPTFFDFPDDENTYNQNFEYIFTGRYLVAPVYKAEVETKIREVYLPGKGFEWQDYWTGEKYKTGQTIILTTSHKNIPIFTRSK